MYLGKCCVCEYTIEAVGDGPTIFEDLLGIYALLMGVIVTPVVGVATNFVGVEYAVTFVLPYASFVT